MKINKKQHITKDGVVKRNPSKKNISQKKAIQLIQKELNNQLKNIKNGEKFMSNGVYNYHPEYKKYNASDVNKILIETPINFVKGVNKDILMVPYNLYYVMNDGVIIQEYNSEVWFEEPF